MSWAIDAERDIWRAICSPNRWIDGKTHPRSLWYFVHLAWGAEFYFRKHPEQPRWLIEKIHEPYLAWLQTHILQWKQYCLAGGTDRYYVASILPRGFGKTVTTTKSAMIWAHLDEPDMSTLIASSTGPLAEDIYKSIQAVLSGEDEDSWFSWLFGNWRKGAKEWTRSHLQHGFRSSKNLSEPSFDTTAVDIGMTGYHHRIHVWDDPIIKNKRREGRDAYDRAVHDAVNASYNALQTNGLLMFVLTRYYDDDVAGKHLRDEGVATWSGIETPSSAVFEKIPLGKGIWHVYFLQTEDELTGDPIHPLLWDRKKIAEAKSRDPEDFACQQQNNPGTGERAPLLESQLPDLFMDYNEFQYSVPVEGVSVHLDTAFKRLETVRTGDDSVIVPWYHDARRNGIVYLDTDNMRCSNEWREEQYNDELVKVMSFYRRKIIYIKAMTDEVEPGGKAGSYKNRILSVLYASGIRLGTETFKQLNRTGNKKARIRSNLGYWAEGYVKILLHKDAQGKWIIPPIVRKLFGQILRIDVTSHEDLADASVDVFVPGIWRRPLLPTLESDEGAHPIQVGDENLKAMSRKLTTEEIYEMIDVQKAIQEDGPGRGWDNEYDFELPQDPV